ARNPRGLIADAINSEANFSRPAAAGPALLRILIRFRPGRDLLQQACRIRCSRPSRSTDHAAFSSVRLSQSADKAPDKLRLNPRKSSYDNLEAVTPNGDYEVTFRLKRPQPAFPMLLAGGFSVIYPCHVSATQMRQHPIGTGPFKFVEFKP